MNKKLITVDFGFGTADVFKGLFISSGEYKVPKQIDDNTVVCFEGGVDIDTQLYDEPRGKWTGYPHQVRDDLEVSVANLAISRGAGMIGVCRGAQLLTTLAGGKLFQHVTNHDYPHLIKTNQGKRFSVTSSHHQMMNPFVLSDNEYQLLAWTSGSRERDRNITLAVPECAISSVYYNGWNREEFIPEKEPEVIWYPKIRALCIQGHPEWASEKSIFRQYCQDLVKQFLL
jgi:gamma-glutamyl-gamma-aminobutyrate hydrolase PuuD